MNETFDLIVVGAGPSGLSVCNCATIAGKKVLLIEKESTLGGCHRVTRTETNHFSEHGPRIYSDVYLNFKILLGTMGIKFNDLFIDYSNKTLVSCNRNSPPIKYTDGGLSVNCISLNLQSQIEQYKYQLPLL